MELRTTESTSTVGTVEDRSLRERVEAALGDEEFVAAVHRRTEGTPSYPEPRRERYDALDALPTAPVDDRAVWEELVVYSTTHVYRWAGGVDATPTRLPRSPEGFDD